MLSSAVKRARAARREESGFTLIELLIVIVILGVLAAVVVFSVRGINDRGNESACRANLATTETAIEAFVANDPDGDYPASLAALIPDYLRSDPSDTGKTDVDVVGYNPATGAVGAGTACD